LRRLLPLLALAACLIVPSAASAAELGLNLAGGTATTTAQVDEAAGTGAKWARHFLFMNDVGNDGLAQFGRVLEYEQSKGMQSLIVVARSDRQPPNTEEYAQFMGRLAARYKGLVDAYEVWNEQDEAGWWAGGPNPGAYVGLLKASYAAIKASDPAATVVMGPFTGNNYGFLEQAYAAGAKGSFDAVAVHTDTACNIDSPYSYYRDPGAGNRIARFTFLGVIPVREVMAANGDGDKKIWISEMGWEVSGAVCGSGQFAGKKQQGVTEAQQAQFLREAIHCLSDKPYVANAMWFTDRNPGYGLFDHPQTLAAFKDIAARGDTLTGPCGDFTAPQVQIVSPKPGEILPPNAALRIQATSPDKDVVRMTYKVFSQEQEIRNFTNGGNPIDMAGTLLEWQGAKKLPFGNHKVVVTAIDPQGNEGTASVDVVKADPAKLPQRAVKFDRLSLGGKGRSRTIKVRIATGLPYAAQGKFVIQWQNRRGRRWKKIHGGARNASSRGRNVTVTFRQKLKYGGRWRVRVQYKGVAPFRTTNSKWKYFKA